MSCCKRERAGIGGRAARLAGCGIVIALVITTSGDVRAAGWAVGEQSVVAAGTGGAGTARAGEAGAAWYNPAALADGGGLQVGVGLLLALPSIAASSTAATSTGGGWAAETDSALKTPPHLYASYAHRSFVGGVAVNVPFGSGVVWPDDWVGRFESVSSNVQVFRVAPFIGWRFGPLRIAAGAHVDLAQLRIERRLDFVDTEGDVTLELDGVGVGGDVAVYYQALRNLAFGASYKSRTRITLDGSALFNTPDAFAGKAPNQAIGSQITLPDLLTVGAQYDPHHRFSVAVDVGLAVWSVLQRIAIDFAEEGTDDTALTPRWETRPFVRAGVEYRPLERLAVRGGLLYDPSPAPGETLAPSSPDSNRLGFTVGVGARLVGGLYADAFYGHTRLLGNTSAAPDALRASYDGTIHLFGAGLRYAQR